MGLFSKALGQYLKGQKQKERQREIAYIKVNNLMVYINEREKYTSIVKTVKTISTQFDMIFDRLQRIKEIEVQYPNIISPNATDLILRFKQKKNFRIKDFAINEADLNIEKAKAITRKTSKISILDKSIMLVIEAKNEIDDGSCLEEIGIGESFTTSPSHTTVHTGPYTAVHVTLDKES